MKRFCTYFLLSFALITFSFATAFGQYPGYYKINTIKGTVYNADKTPIEVEFISRYKLKMSNCPDPDVDTMLRTMTLTRLSRMYLTHLLTTSSKIVMIVSDKIGLSFSEGKYRFIGGLCGPDNNQSHLLIPDLTSNLCPHNKMKHPYYVYEENTITIFKGSISYFHNGTPDLTEKNVQIFNLDSNRYIETFSMDTIVPEKIMHPDMLYSNTRELYYFGGTHEAFHTTAESICENDTDLCEEKAFALETKMFKKRKVINRRKLHYP